jgi:hypothetical protein
LVGEKNKKYFNTELRNGQARAYLVGQSQLQLDNIITELPSEEVEIHHSIAAIVSSSATGQKQMLANTISNVAAVLIKQIHNIDVQKDNQTIIDEHYKQKQRNIWETKIPTTYSLICRLYVGGKFAMIPNTPKSAMHLVGNHGYVSLKDCIADILAPGYEIDVMTPIKDEHSPIVSISQSNRAQKILQNA